MFRRIGLLAATVLTIAAVGAVPAEAGGPTSVLLSAPYVPKVVAAGYEDANYTRLMELTGRADNREPGGSHASGTFVRATWLIHDMRVWRLDVIYPDAPGGPWIATREDVDGTGLSVNPVWHRATDPVQLIKLLDTLGLLRGQRSGEISSGGPTSLPVDKPAAAAPAAQPSPSPAEVVTADPGTFSGWRWSIPGFLLGALVAVLAVRLLPKRRWELVDVE